MSDEQTAFQIDRTDNVATALVPLAPGAVTLLGDAERSSVQAVTNVPQGHKIALRDFAVGEPIVKYGVVIGQATAEIAQGSWVHLHVMRSLYDERSGHLDVETGVPCDTRYE